MWVFGEATPELAQWWEQVPLLYPEKAPVFHRAKETLLAIQGETFTLPPARVRHNIRRITEATQPAVEPLNPERRYTLPVWRWAAAAVLVIGMAWLGWDQYQRVSDPTTRIYQELTTSAATPLEEVTNTTSDNKLVMLTDGSSVLLLPNSRISFPREFNSHAQREVYLTGEAFFEVAKNPEKPFFVYANNIITKVLGTSFTVKATKDDQINVIVKTGKVSVFTRSDKERVEKQQSKQLAGLVLTPNQRMVFDQEDGRLLRSLVDSPTILDIPIQRAMFEFSGTPINRVFAALERAYGVEIVFDEEVMKNCFLTASLDDEPLFEKLSMICRTLDAHHEQMDGKIIITSKGCR